MVDNNKAELVDFTYFTENSVPITSGPGVLPAEKKSKKASPKKTKSSENNGDSVERVNGEIVDDDDKTINNFKDTMGALRNTVIELDMLASDMKSDLNAIRASRTLKGRYQYASMLGQNIAGILSTKVQAIKEMNATIKNAIDLDYKINKDRQAADTGTDDQKMMELYNAFISAPIGSNAREALGPSMQQITLPGSDRIELVSRGPVTDSNMMISPDVDPGYAAYIQNMSPEQHRIMLETNPNVKEVVTYNPSTGEKHFAIQNTETGEFLQGVSHHDDMFLEDCTINTKNKIARNVNLNESFPLVIMGGEKADTMNGF